MLAAQNKNELNGARFGLRTDVQAGLGLLFWGMWGVTYRFFNLWNEASERAIYLERPVDVMPWVIHSWTVIIYLVVGLLLPLIPWVLGLGKSSYYETLVSYFLVSLVAFLTYWIFPLCMQRPDFNGSHWGDVLMRLVKSADHDANCFPSLHSSFAVLAALWIVHYVRTPAVRVVACLSAFAVCLSTITTGQHYLIDVAGGVVLAFFSFALARVIGKWIEPRLTTQEA